MGYIKKQSKYKVLTPKGYQEFDGIRKLKKSVLLIETKNGSIRVTEDHPFVVKGEKILAKNLKIGSYLEGKTSLIKVENIKPDGEDWVYDLINVKNGNVYYANDILVHNCFHAPGKSVIDPELLEKMKQDCKEPIMVFDDGAYKIFEKPNPDSYYVIGVDVGEGIGRTNSVAQILDVTDLKNIKQVAVYANNNIGPHHFGKKLMGILLDWGKPPILIENNNFGQEVLNVLHIAYNYEYIVSYKFEGMSRHYNNENRLGIHSHTNTKYKGMANFRYWVDFLKAVKINDFDTLLEISQYVQLPNYTFSKKNDSDRDDRVFGFVWALFILDPTITKDFFNIKETDDQGRPLYISPIIDRSDDIKKSPLFSGKINIIVKKEFGNFAPPSILLSKDDNSSGLEMEEAMLGMWLHQWKPTDNNINEYKQHNPVTIWKSNQEKKEEPSNTEFSPIILF